MQMRMMMMSNSKMFSTNLLMIKRISMKFSTTQVKIDYLSVIRPQTDEEGNSQTVKEAREIAHARSHEITKRVK